MAQNSRPSAGDLTGNIKQSQQKEALQEQRDAAQQMSLASAIEAEEQQEGVFDPVTQTRLDVPTVAEVTEEPFVGGKAFYQSQTPQEPVFTGYETEEQMTPFLATRAEPVIPQSVVRSPMVKIRVSQDIEEMTYGMTAQGYPNNMTFREGFTYEVRVDIAEHLNQRNLVAQFLG